MCAVEAQGGRSWRGAGSSRGRQPCAGGQWSVEDWTAILGVQAPPPRARGHGSTAWCGGSHCSVTQCEGSCHHASSCQWPKMLCPWSHTQGNHPCALAPPTHSSTHRASLCPCLSGPPLTAPGLTPLARLSGCCCSAELEGGAVPWAGVMGGLLQGHHRGTACGGGGGGEAWRREVGGGGGAPKAPDNPRPRP